MEARYGCEHSLPTVRFSSKEKEFNLLLQLLLSLVITCFSLTAPSYRACTLSSSLCLSSSFSCALFNSAAATFNRASCTTKLACNQNWLVTKPWNSSCDNNILDARIVPLEAILLCWRRRKTPWHMSTSTSQQHCHKPKNERHIIRIKYPLLHWNILVKVNHCK